MKDRVVLITGAGQGIGEATMKRIHAEGATVVGLDRKEDTLAKVCESLGCRTGYGVADLRDHDALRDAVTETIEAHGKIDALICNAGFSYYGPSESATIQQWRDTFAVNVEGHAVLIQAVIPHMKTAGYGRIVNIGSIQGITPESGVGPYAASKAAIHSMTRSLAVELAQYGINVNAIAPGAIRTPMSIVNGKDEFDNPDFQEWYCRRRKIPLGRPGRPEEIANAALFLASEEASYVTGHTMVVDGGLTITF